ncbi:neutral zinc metallopeptidase [Kutzneria sp. CA-103260]|uniref:neutral zinc metallopeptidase n=1 Tax=Kutzneria sp. CA-103260 TaxID=2802641 RepID=UPI001BA94784|nr:neutral zinc metallopeptidase [Kutzneria sp. CA-103260]QUQ68985.1 Putative neutral zinc metallopeptidase [Kutzneria sp. CA-103260]
MNPWNTGDEQYRPLPPPLPSPYPQSAYPQNQYPSGQSSPYGQPPPPPPGYQPYPMPPARPVMPPPVHAQRPTVPPPVSPYPPPVSPYPPPLQLRRPSRRPFVTLFLIGLVVLGVVVVGVVGNGRSRPRTVPSPTSLPTSVPTTSPGSGPGSTPDGVDKLGDNPLFTASGPGPVTCTLPRWQSVSSASNAYFTAALPCLDRAWQPVLQSVHLPFHEPKLAFPSGKTWSSPCGSVSQEEAAAFYCNGDQTLYMPISGLQTDEIGNRPGAYLAVFAHEYGHFVQDLSGVLTAAHEKEYGGNNPDSPASLEVSRRIELQAQCFSGLFLAAAVGRGSVDATVARDAQNTQDRGDQPGERRDHGTSDHASGWWTQGFVKKTVAQCNTWVASSADVQ